MNYANEIFKMLNIKPNEKFKLVTPGLKPEESYYYLTDDLTLKCVSDETLLTIKNILNGTFEICIPCNENNWDDDLYPWY